MNYFINFGMPASKSGIEHAQIKRKRLFDKHGEPYVFLLRDWERIYILTLPMQELRMITSLTCLITISTPAMLTWSGCYRSR